MARDTQFQGFAKLLLKNMEEVSCTTYASMEDAIRAHELLIAQRAYDLACHVWNETIGGGNPENAISSVPDMTEWPKRES